jgi:uncharacterized repeat protein (TIGR01451 family)
MSHTFDSLTRSTITLFLSALFVISVPFPGQADWITIEPDTPQAASNCMPFGLGDHINPTSNWTPYAVWVYRDVPAFTLEAGNTLAFDLATENDTDIGLDIHMAPTTYNGGHDEDGAFVKIVSNTQDPGRGDTVVGNYDLEFTAESTFNFPGGGLLIRFSNPSSTYLTDSMCTLNLVSGEPSDTSGYFFERFLRDTDGFSPWENPAHSDIGAFRVQSTPTFDLEKSALNSTGEVITATMVGETVSYRIDFSNNGAEDITGLEITDTLPENLDYIGATSTPAAAVTYDGGPPATVLWTVGDVAAGGSASLNIDVLIEAGADNELLVNQAQVSAIDSPLSPGEIDTANLVVGGADLEVTLNVTDFIDMFDNDWPHALNVYFNFTISNHGPATATSVQLQNHTVTDPVFGYEPPDGIKWHIKYPLPAELRSWSIDTTTQTFACEFYDLDPGESVVITQSFKMDEGGRDIDFTYNTSVSSGGVDPVPENNNISGTITVVRTGSGSGGCSTSIGFVPEGPAWPGAGIAALMAIVLLLLRRRTLRVMWHKTQTPVSRI